MTMVEERPAKSEAEKPADLKPGQTRIKVAGMGSWIFDENELDLTDAFAIKATGQMTVPQMLNGLIQMEPLALQVLVWFCRMKAGDNVPLASINYKLKDFDLEQADPEEQTDGADPTTGDGSTD